MNGPSPMHLRLWLAAAFALSCTTPVSPSDTGPHRAAHTTFTLTDASRERTLTVEAWYPTARPDAPTGEPPTAIAEYVPDPTNRATYERLLADAPADCPTRVLGALRDAAPIQGKFPVIALSHCHGCVRFELATIAEHLATHGLAVVAPDHAGNTMFESIAGTNRNVDATTLALRVADIRFVLDRVLDPAATELPAALRGKFDPEHVGMLGHSFGSPTAGSVTRDDARIKAVAGLAAPMESPILPGIVMEDVKVPLLLAVADEDNTIEEIGNGYLRDNFENAGSPAWQLELADAGHFSFTDIAGLRTEWMPGCGSATRQTDRTKTFDYTPVATLRQGVATWLAAFFGAHLADDPGARAFLESPDTLEAIKVRRK